MSSTVFKVCFIFQFYHVSNFVKCSSVHCEFSSVLTREPLSSKHTFFCLQQGLVEVLVSGCYLLSYFYWYIWETFCVSCVMNEFEFCIILNTSFRLTFILGDKLCRVAQLCWWPGGRGGVPLAGTTSRQTGSGLWGPLHAQSFFNLCFF